MRRPLCAFAILTSIFILFFFISGTKAEGSVIKGTILDSENRVVEGAKITVCDPLGEQIAVTRSNSLGVFQFSEIEYNFISFIIEAKGFYSQRIEKYSFDPDTLQNFSLRLFPKFDIECSECEKGTISGIVIDGITGEPIPGARVKLTSSDIGGRTTWDGKYKIMNIPTGKSDISAKVIGFSTTNIEDVALDGGKGFKMNIIVIHGMRKSLGIIID